MIQCSLRKVFLAMILGIVPISLSHGMDDNRAEQTEKMTPAQSLSPINGRQDRGSKDIYKETESDMAQFVVRGESLPAGTSLTGEPDIMLVQFDGTRSYPEPQ